MAELRARHPSSPLDMPQNFLQNERNPHIPNQGTQNFEQNRSSNQSNQNVNVYQDQVS